MKRPRLLPADEDLGWTPFAWLVYLVGLVIFLVLLDGDAMDWLATGALVAVFLPLYFRGFWLRGNDRLVIVAAIALLGFAGVFVNPGASVFWIYAGAFLGGAARPGKAFRLLLLLAALIAIETLLFTLHPGIWIPGLVFTLLIGAINIHFDEVGRKNRQLRLAQEEVQRLARTAERERIARDLHDILGHTLSVIVLKSELASKLADREPDRAAVEIRDVEAISRQALSEVRHAVEGYRSDSGSLTREIDNARRALGSAEVRLEVDRREDAEDLPAAEETVLALVLREAVTNVVRHADATSCRVRVEVTDGSARLEIDDDGQGGDFAEGSGLKGMRERVEALGGEVVRRSDEGTQLAITLPLHPLPKAPP